MHIEFWRHDKCVERNMGILDMVCIDWDFAHMHVCVWSMNNPGEITLFPQELEFLAFSGKTTLSF